MNTKTEWLKHIVFLISFLALPGGSALGAEWTLDKDQRVKQPKP